MQKNENNEILALQKEDNNIGEPLITNKDKSNNLINKVQAKKQSDKRKKFLEDPDYSGFKPLGKHIIFVEPDPETESGIQLLEGSDAAKVQAEETFSEDIYITCLSDECERDLQIGDHIMINFHAQFVRFKWKGVNHAMVHEDYILARLRPSDNPNFFDEKNNE